jgi:hypothetical protein
MLHPINVHPLEKCPVRPSLLAISQSLIVFPIAHKYHAGSLSINTVAFGLIVQPLPLVNVAVIVYQPAHAIGFIVSPVALVYRTNAPDLFASSILFIIFPLPLVDVFSIDKGCGFEKRTGDLEFSL